MTPLVLVTTLLAGAIGTVGRYALSRALPVRPGHLPGGILLANAVGSAVAGVVLGLAERAALGEDIRLILLTGFCGGLTTFSTWNVETIELATGGRWRAALLNIVVTLTVGLAACAGAYLLTR